MEFRCHYGYDVREASDEAAVVAVGESLTVQSMADDADINVLMRRFGVTGHMPVNPRIPTYGDFSGVTDYRSALEAVQAGEDAFMELPAELRARFSNSPQVYLEFCSDERNRDKMREFGLLKEVSDVGSSVGGSGPGVAPGGSGAAPGSGAGRDARVAGGGAAASGAA